jgi:hypothetical protein
MPAHVDYTKPFADAFWFDIVPRAAAYTDLPARVLLHAGPPFRGAPPTPVLHAAIQALLFENLAADEAAARELLLRGDVQLRPAQDHGIVTPLAQVVSASMPLVAVRQHAHVCHAPVIEGPAPALRFGSAAPECRRRLKDLGVWLESVVAPRLRREPLGIEAVIRTAIAAGEECHAHTSAANEAVVSAMVMMSTPDGLDADHAAELRASPAFVLPILMAAAAAALRSSRSSIEAIGGNGIDFGVRQRGSRTWRQTPAQAPQGVRFAGAESVTALGAIGDSAVVDFCGLGGQALDSAALARRGELIDPNTGIVDPERIARGAPGPLINLAILDRDGVAGLIGRGVYCPPTALFSRDQ